MSNNIIPKIGAEGSFTAIDPFDRVCSPDIVYRVEANRTVEEIRVAKVNTQALIGSQVGFSADETNNLLADLESRNGVVVTLIAPGLKPLHIPSTYFKSFPTIDGVVYERYFLTMDLGALPPDYKNETNTLMNHLKDQVSAFTGVKDPIVHLGTIPTKGYVSKEQHEVNERSRKLQITKSESDAEYIKRLEEDQIKDRKYIALLESKLKQIQ